MWKERWVHKIRELEIAAYKNVTFRTKSRSAARGDSLISEYHINLCNSILLVSYLSELFCSRDRARIAITIDLKLM